MTFNSIEAISLVNANIEIIFFFISAFFVPIKRLISEDNLLSPIQVAKMNILCWQTLNIRMLTIYCIDH